MVRRAVMEQVELLEQGECAPAPADDEVAHARGAVVAGARGALAWSRIHRAMSVAVAVGLAAAIMVPVDVSAREQRALAATFVLMPEVLAPMPEAPRLAWTSAPEPNSGGISVPGRAWIRDGALVVWEQGTGAMQSLRALDASTGAELWRSVLTTAPDLVAFGGRSLDDPTTCLAPDAPVVACLVPNSWRLGSVSGELLGDGTTVVAASLRLRTFAASTGEPLLDRHLTRGSSIVALGPDLVVLDVPETGDGPAGLERIDPSTGTRRWRVDVARHPGGRGSASASVQVLEGMLAVSWFGSTALYSADGEGVGALDADQVSWLRGRAWNLDDTDVLTDLLTGRRVHAGRSYPAWIPTDDGSTPEILLLQGPGIRAVDVTTGVTAWQMPRRAARDVVTMLVADGRLAALGRDGLAVRDLRSGRLVWQRSPDGARGQSLITDGRHVVVLASGLPRTVAAYDLSGGRRAWTVQAPTGIYLLVVVDRHLFGVGVDTITAFTP